MKLLMDENGLAHNLRYVRDLCERSDLRLLPVVKCVSHSPRTLRSLVRLGVRNVAVSRIDPAAPLPAELSGGVTCIRLPEAREIEVLTSSCERTYHSSLSTLDSVSRKAARTPLRVVLAVDLGEGREGIDPRQVRSRVEAVRAFEDRGRIVLDGLAATFGCACARTPTPEQLDRLATCARRAARALGRSDWEISVGGSAVLPLLEAGQVPGEVTELRVGEALFLGTVPGGRPHPRLRRDVFTLVAEILEVAWRARGSEVRRQALVSVGSAHLGMGRPEPNDPQASVIGLTADYCLVDVTASRRSWRVGEEMSFLLDHTCLQSLLGRPAPWDAGPHEAAPSLDPLGPESSEVMS